MLNVSVVYDHFTGLSDQQRARFEALGELYLQWNAGINVISRKDIDQLYVRHVLHSLAIARFADFPPGTHILDVGTGGGFPGIPLAILFPHCHFTLVDSIGKKIHVVNAIIQATGLSNASAAHIRAERVRGEFDFVVSRAVARSKKLYLWTHRLIRPSGHPTLANGYLLLKGGDLHAELEELKRPYTIRSLSDYFSDPFFETKKLVYIPM